MFQVKQEDIKQEIEYVDCLQDIQTYDKLSKYYKQEYEGELVIKEENVSEIKHEQVENEDIIITTYCNNEIINNESNLTKQRSHKTSVKLHKHKCDQCEYSSNKKHNLLKHKLIHTNERPFKCDRCEYSSRQKRNLLTHNVTHSNERPFKCDQCEYSSKYKKHLLIHNVTHTNERPFNCDRCEYICKRKSDLLSHNLTHTNERPFKCDQCEYSCKRKSDLLRHHTTQHILMKDLSSHKQQHTK